MIAASHAPGRAASAEPGPGLGTMTPPPKRDLPQGWESLDFPRPPGLLTLCLLHTYTPAGVLPLDAHADAGIMGKAGGMG